MPAAEAVTIPVTAVGDPAALKVAVAAVPAAAGVYLFEPANGTLPLYIGKSVNLRARLRAHLRAPDETAMLRQTARISYLRTAGEIGALLLEAQLIKAKQPLYNQRLRRNRQLCAIRLDAEGKPEVVYARDVDFAKTRGLHGLFASRHAAFDGLHQIADAHQLCGARLGLERLPAGRRCFRAMLGRCAGVCAGDETPAAHDERLRAALARLTVDCWPYDGPIGILERDALDASFSQIHVVNNWCYLGSATSPEAARKLHSVAANFDVDGYKVLCGPILQNSVEILRLEA